MAADLIVIKPTSSASATGTAGQSRRRGNYHVDANAIMVRGDHRLRLRGGPFLPKSHETAFPLWT